MNEPTLQKVVEDRMANIQKAIEAANTENYVFLLLMAVKSRELGPCDILRVFGCSNTTPDMNVSMVREFMAMQPKQADPQSIN